MKRVKVRIYNQRGKLRKIFTPKKMSDLYYMHEMFTENRSFDFSEQFADFIRATGKTESKQTYSLYNTFVKFGSAHQEQADFVVIMRTK